MSLPCSEQSCKRPSSYLCYFCKKNYCNEHLKRHDYELNHQLNPLNDQIKNLSSQYKHLNTSKLISEFRQRLDVWRDESHQTIDRLYKEKREELSQDWSKILAKPQKDIDELQSNINKLIKKQRTTHEDINHSIETLHSIRQQMLNIQQNGITIDIQPIVFGTPDYPIVTNNEIPPENLDTFNLTSLPLYRTIDCLSQSGVAFANSHQNLLIYEEKNLNLYNKDLISIQKLPWTNGHIFNMCWSTKLNHFILITDKRIVYVIDEKSLTFTPIKTIPKENWWSLTCSDKHLYLSTHGNDANIFQFDLASTFHFIKRWRSPQTCQQHEFIHNINYTNDALLLIIGDASNNSATIELRSSTTLQQIWTLEMDTNHLSYQSTIHSCLLKHNEWIIIIENTSDIFYISQDGQLKEVYDYQQPIWNALLFDSSLLAIRTGNSINFHKI